MTLKEQIGKIKDNWLLVLLVVVLLGVLAFGGGNVGSNIGGITSAKMASLDSSYGGGYDESARSISAPSAIYYDQGFAPEETDRKITKTAYLSTETERGEFQDADSKLKAIIKSSDSFLLNENVNKYGESWRSYYSGSYSIKVETGKYDSIITQLKEIGEVQSFSESADDITGQYTDLQTQLATEQERLKRYREMYAEAEKVEDKININDRIFNQETTVKYLEKAIKNADQRVDYSTIQFTITEKQSGFMQMEFVKLSELITNFVNSLSSLLAFVFSVLPWAIAILVGWLVVKKVRGTKK
ncbi:hypothetical protein COV19_01770 [Candidatus Woesearchaeota archaeon CG10_big_fil_rev_8_21_14_0_10_44_13]|nr:MAG: hypothetical protein COV19_01770 [Candidatus Woesearchaeota archaeon CG10_big_fil_rev_8_21_14_0_10_44_13]